MHEISWNNWPFKFASLLLKEAEIGMKGHRAANHHTVLMIHTSIFQRVLKEPERMLYRHRLSPFSNPWKMQVDLIFMSLINHSVFVSVDMYKYTVY